MKDLCIPIPHYDSNIEINILVTVGNEDKHIEYKVGVFPWEEEEDEKKTSKNNMARKISSLKKGLETFDNNWELVQLLTPSKDAKYIQVLFRKRQ